MLHLNTTGVINMYTVPWSIGQFPHESLEARIPFYTFFFALLWPFFSPLFVHFQVLMVGQLFIMVG
jgi:hypothetical protein